MSKTTITEVYHHSYLSGWCGVEVLGLIIY